MNAEETPAKTSETLTVQLHLGNGLTFTGSAPAFRVVDGEPRGSVRDRFAALSEAVHAAVLKLIEEANAKADWTAAQKGTE